MSAWVKWIGACALGVVATGAVADPCDYRPSKVAKDGAAPAARAVKEAGFYTLNGIASGGAAVGTGGAGALSTAGAVATAPATVIAGAVAAAGLAGYEGLCYFSDKRVTGYDEVLTVMRNLAANADPDFFRLDEGGGKKDAAVTLRNSAGEMEQYPVSDLYIVNGELRYRSKGRDGVIGNVDFVARSSMQETGVPLSAVKTEPAPVAGEVVPAAAAPDPAADPAPVAPPAVEPETPDAAPAAPVPAEAAAQP